VITGTGYGATQAGSVVLLMARRRLSTPGAVFHQQSHSGRGDIGAVGGVRSAGMNDSNR